MRFGVLLGSNLMRSLWLHKLAMEDYAVLDEFDLAGRCSILVDRGVESFAMAPATTATRPAFDKAALRQARSAALARQEGALT